MNNFNPQINADADMQLLPVEADLIDLTENPNLHTILRKTMEKFKLDPSRLDALTNSPTSETISEITRQLSLIKFSIKSSCAQAFKLVDFKKKFPLVIELIDLHFFHMNSSVPLSESDLKTLDYNQLFERMNISSLRHLPLGDIIQTQLLLKGQQTKKVAYKKVVSDFFGEIEDRHLPKLSNFQVTENHLLNEGLPVINRPDSSLKIQANVEDKDPNCNLIEKPQLIKMIEELEGIYVIVGQREQWKQHIDYLRKRVTESFHSYCHHQKEYQHLIKVRSKIETWVDHYDQLLKTVKPSDEPDQNFEVGMPSNLESILSQKFEADQLFLAETLKSLNIEEVRQKMEMSSKIFKLHHQIVEDLTQCLPKPNCCHICLTNEANQFISTCGHIICFPCAETMMVENNQYRMNLNEKQSSCPYCNKPFTLNDLRKIFYS
jgi:hypothetical protein